MKTVNSTFFLACLFASHAHSHGTPMHVEVIDNRLTVSHPDDQAFAPPIFGQGDGDDDFTEMLFLPTLGNIVLWDKPGLEIHGMNDNTSLSIEILARPVIDSSPAQKRVLWYWNPQTQTVETAAADFHLLGTELRSLTLSASSQTTPLPFLLSNPMTGQTGFHNHGLLYFALDDDNSAPAGIYGFFARLTSNQYDPSDPFLMVFNYATDYESLIPASLAIHAAGTLAGDYDLDDDVDGRDFLVWQRLYGSTTRTVADGSLNGVVDSPDLTIWQQVYGTQFGALTALSTLQVPEPNVFTLLCTALTMLASRKRQRPEVKKHDQ